MTGTLNSFVRKTAVAAAFALAATSGAAQAELGPKIGSTIPHDLSATDSQGAARSLADLAGKNGLVLYFIRSVDWCPYCKAQTITVDAAQEDFAARGLSVVFVSYDSIEKQAQFAKQFDLRATLLSDPKSEIIDAFGLRNETHKEGRFAGIPHPAAFVVTPDGKIAAKLYEEDYLTNDKSYRRRPEVSAVLAAADAALK